MSSSAPARSGHPWSEVDPTLRYLFVQACATITGWLLGVWAVLPRSPLPDPLGLEFFVVPFGHVFGAAACALSGARRLFAPKGLPEVAMVALITAVVACLKSPPLFGSIGPLLVALGLNALFSFRIPRLTRGARWPWLAIPVTLAIGLEVHWVIRQISGLRHLGP